MKTSGLAKWGEKVSSKIRLFLDALKRFNEDHCFLPGIVLKANFAASILWEVASFEICVKTLMRDIIIPFSVMTSRRG